MWNENSSTVVSSKWFVKNKQQKDLFQPILSRKNSSQGRLVQVPKKGSISNSIFCIFFINQLKSRDSSVGIALGYGLDDRGSGVRFPAGDGNFSLHHRVQNGSGTHPASYPMDTRGSFSGDKAAGA
jgi:hypothetical protein